MLGDALAPADIAIAEGRIVAAPAPAAVRFDATGLLVLPGIVDVHGDAHERCLEPRPGVPFAADLALRDAAAQIAAAGITTAFLAVTLSWEPGLRSLEAWRALRVALAALDPAVDLRVHIRFEADNLDALDEAIADLAAGRVQLLSFNDHTPAILRRLDDPATLGKYAARGGVSPEAFRDLALRVAARRDEVPAARARLAAAARAARVPMLSHDDATIADREAFRALGATICEFPVAEAVAAAARAADEAVVMGAPNVVRGGSHLGWASAGPLAERGLVTVLASDYHWPAPLHAAFALAARGRLDLGRAWALVAGNPAAAAGLTDRGRIAPGLRGDLVVVDPAGPSGVATIAGGRFAHLGALGAARLLQ